MDSKEKTIDNSLESTMNMNQDEIEWLLNQQFGENTNSEPDILDEDLKSLLASFEGTDEGDIQDISELLNKADNNEAVDEEIAALLKAQEEPGETAYDAMDLFSTEPKQPKKESVWKKLFHRDKTKKKDKKEKKNKKLKEKIDENDGRLELKNLEFQTAMLTESKSESMGDALALLQGMATAESEPDIPPKKEKEKPNKKKNKKDKKKAAEDKETKKAKKAEKNKAEKVIKVKEKPTIEDAIRELEEEAEEPPHKKKIIMVFMASILILIGFLVVNFYFTRHASKKLAREAYEDKDYLECYQLLYGQKLDDSQAVMFHRSKLILKDDIFWRDYEGYVKQSKWLEGLDELVQYVYGYPKLSEYAKRWNSAEIVEETHRRIQEILEKEYVTDVQTVMNIAELSNDEDYTRALLKIVEEKQKKDAIYEKYPDLLPEEEDRLFQ